MLCSGILLHPHHMYGLSLCGIIAVDAQDAVHLFQAMQQEDPTVLIKWTANPVQMARFRIERFLLAYMVTILLLHLYLTISLFLNIEITVIIREFISSLI